jgi:hypothetical protein
MRASRWLRLWTACAGGRAIAPGVICSVIASMPSYGCSRWPPRACRPLWPRSPEHRRSDGRLLRHRDPFRGEAVEVTTSRPTRSGRPTTRHWPCRSGCAPAGRARSRRATAASSAASPSITCSDAALTFSNARSSRPASISARSRSSMRRSAPAITGSPITTR